MADRPEVPKLRLVREAKVRALLPGGGPPGGEASGVLPLGDDLLVIFDDSTSIGIIDQSLTTAVGNRTQLPIPEFLAGADAGGGYEDIALDPDTGDLYLLVEALPRANGFMARVEVVDQQFRRKEAFWLDFPLVEENKGIEGLVFVVRDGHPFLLALCEGNRCKGGPEGRTPGGGTIHVFRPRPESWERVGTINLPSWLWFEDYSSAAMIGNRIAVVSQRSSALWIGELAPTAWEIIDAGTCFEFPLGINNEVVYCTVEGVAWVGDDRIVVVSDQAGDTDLRCKQKQRSVHFFDIPVPQ